MSSLNARLLISVSVLLLFFFGVTIVVLDTAFRSAGEQAQADILDGHLMAILAAAEATDDGGLELPPDLQEPRFGAIGSGLYAELRGDAGEPVWRSRSALGIDIPVGEQPQSGVRLFLNEVLADGTPVLTLSLAVQWSCQTATTGRLFSRWLKALSPLTRRLHSSDGSYLAGLRRLL